MIIKLKRNKKKGFSLTELLVTVTILTIMAAIVIPLIFGTMSQAKEVQQRRNAQAILNMATQAQIAGNTTIATASSLAEVLMQLREGVSGAGAFASTTFRVDGLGPREWKEAGQVLAFDNGCLCMKPV